MTKNQTRDKVLTGLAGAAALASGSQAYGNIINVGSLPGDLPNAAATGTAIGANYDMNNDGTVDMHFEFRNPQAAGTGVQWQANVFPAVAGDGIIGYVGPFVTYAYKKAAGFSIGPAGPWVGTTAAAQVVLGSRYRSGGVVSSYGGFGTTTTSRGFLGVRFLAAGAPCYGWLDVEVRASTAAANSGGIFFFGGAYDCQAAIPAGTTPEPASLAMLAVGAAALLGRRRKTA